MCVCVCVCVRVSLSIDHFTVVCLVAWPLNESEAGIDLVLIETILFSCLNFFYHKNLSKQYSQISLTPKFLA